MKRMLSLLVFCCGGTLAFSQAPMKLSTTVNAGIFAVNKQQVNKDWKIAPMKTLLHSSGRERKGVNLTHSYDDLGVVLFEKIEDSMPTGIFTEMQLYFQLGDSKVSTTAVYTGSLVIEGQTITSDLSWEKLKAKLSMYEQSDSYMSHHFRLAFKGLYIYFQYSDDELQLKKISIGPDKKTAG